MNSQMPNVSVVPSQMGSFRTAFDLKLIKNQLTNYILN